MTNEIYIDVDKQLYEKNYQIGYQEGLQNAENKAHENGFKEGVQVTYLMN
jgi:hypothetical protein